MNRQLLVGLLIPIAATHIGCGSSDSGRLESPELAPPVSAIKRENEHPDLIPYTIIQSSEVLQYKKSFDVEVDLVNGRLPTEAQLASISNYLRNSAGVHERTFVVFYLPGMVLDHGGFATAHHNPDLEFKLLRFNVPDDFRLLLPPEQNSPPEPPMQQRSEPLDVIFEVSTEWEDNRIVILGKTNLPDGTEIGGSVFRREPQFIGQTRAKVQHGEFRLGPFGPSYGLGHGVYEVSATMPIPRMQSAEVRAIIGANGENLRGERVDNGPIGVTVGFSTIVRKE